MVGRVLTKAGLPGIISVIAIIAAICIFSAEDAAAETIDSGSCGETVTWEVDDQGLLSIQGEGPMDENVPWSEYGDIIREVNIGNGVTSIADGAFMLFKTLSAAEIPESVESIGECAFASSGIQEIVIPDSTTQIGTYAFSGCKSLTQITLGTGINKISYGLFKGCRSLSEIIIPETVESIGGRAFADCKSLTSLIVPDAVTTTGNAVTQGCSSLETIIIRGAAGSDWTWESADYTGTVYYRGNDPTWTKARKAATFPKAAWIDSTTVVYDATGNTAPDTDGATMKTIINEEDTQDAAETIRLLRPSLVVVHAVTSAGAGSARIAHIQLPANYIHAVRDVGAAVTVKTSIGTIALDQLSVQGAISDETQSVELIMANESDKSDILTVIYNVGLMTMSDDQTTEVSELAGSAKITVSVPSGTLAADSISSYFIGSDAREQLKATRTKKEVTTVTTKMGRIKSTSDEFKNAKVTASNLIYTGKKQSPKLKVTIGKKTLSSKCYKVATIKNNKAVGTATFTVQGVGKYSGKKSGSFFINPKKAVISKVTAGKRKITVKMKTRPSATGGTKYKIEYRIAGKGKWKSTTTTSYTKTIKNLKKGKRYQVRVKAYKGKRVGAVSSIIKSGKVK